MKNLIRKQVKLSMYALGVFLFIGSSGIFAQDAPKEEVKEEFKPSGKAFGKVFFNFHYDMTDSPSMNKPSQFQLNRTYFGYKYTFSEKISGKICFDVGSVGSSVHTAFLKVAYIDWKVAKPIKLSIGQIGLKQFNDQEKFWGYRYIYKSFMDQHKFGSSADKGININIKPHKVVQFNLLAVNGEGYKKAQDDYGQYKMGGSVIITPVEGLIIKGYFDMMPKKFDSGIIDSSNTVWENVISDTSQQQSASVFIGYNYKKKVRVGVEYNMQTNNKNIEENNLTGISVYAAYVINKKFEAFARYDILESAGNTNGPSTSASDTTLNWNYQKDGNALIVGFQFKPVKGVSMALNYQAWTYGYTEADKEIITGVRTYPEYEAEPKVYISFEYKF